MDKDWRWLPQQFDASILSDEATAPGQPSFTGAFVGMACQDLAGTASPADFDYFEYGSRNYRENPLVPFDLPAGSRSNPQVSGLIREHFG